MQIRYQLLGTALVVGCWFSYCTTDEPNVDEEREEATSVQTSDDHAKAAAVIAELEAEAMAQQIKEKVHANVDPASLEIMVRDAFGHFSVFIEEVGQQMNTNYFGVTLSPENLEPVIVDIHKESPFFGIGLEPDDVITTINGVEIKSSNDPIGTVNQFLTEHLLDNQGSLSIEVTRDGDHIEIEVSDEVRLINHDDYSHVHQFFNNWTNQSANIWDLSGSVHDAIRSSRIVVMEIEEDLGAYFDVEFGVLVMRAPSTTNLKPGDILLKVGKHNIRAISHFTKFMRTKQPSPSALVPVRVQRRGKEVEIESDFRGLQVIDVNDI